MVPVYLKMEGVTNYCDACKHRLQFDRRPDLSFCVQVGMWNIGGLCVKQVCEE